MTEQQLPPIKRAMPLLGNSSLAILKPLKGCGGTFRVVWLEQIDAHCLWFTRDGEEGSTLLATHNNGFSCHLLAERIISGDHVWACGQLEYIRRCGGTAIAKDFIKFEPKPTP
jgi:hypothetical protein